jgi:hypothetical protein
MKLKKSRHVRNLAIIGLGALPMLAVPGVSEATGEALGAADIVKTFVELTPASVLCL